MLALMERGRRLPWQSAIGGQRHFSEMILYGVYVDEVLTEAEGFPTTSDMRCLNYSDNAPLDANAIDSLVRSLRPTDFAVMVSAKSGTDLGVRRAGFRRLADIPATVTPPPPGKPTQ